MINEVIRLFARWGAVADHGVNDLAASLPRTNFGAEPDDPAPEDVSIFSDVDDSGTARDIDPPDVPAFVLWGVSTAKIDYRGYPLARRITVAGAYVTAEDADPLTAVRNCGYILRAGSVTYLSRYNSQSLSKDYRQHNGVLVLEVADVEEHRLTAAVGRRKMWGMLEINAIVAETLK
jgi:hypothetical protein